MKSIKRKKMFKIFHGGSKCWKCGKKIHSTSKIYKSGAVIIWIKKHKCAALLIKRGRKDKTNGRLHSTSNKKDK